MQDFTKAERRIFAKLRSPARIQDFLDSLAINHEKHGETCYSPRMVLATRKAHCLEGALFAAVALSHLGHRPLVMNLRTTHADDDHAVALFQIQGHWGALSKTNHTVLRYRDPIYRTLRELAMSFFNEYFLDDGRKTLRSYSRPLDLRRFDPSWRTSEKPVWDIAYALADAPHVPLVPHTLARHLRRASPLERKAANAVEWPTHHPRT